MDIFPSSDGGLNALGAPLLMGEVDETGLIIDRELGVVESPREWTGLGWSNGCPIDPIVEYWVLKPPGEPYPPNWPGGGDGEPFCCAKALGSYGCVGVGEGSDGGWNGCCFS